MVREVEVLLGSERERNKHRKQIAKEQSVAQWTNGAKERKQVGKLV